MTVKNDLNVILNNNVIERKQETKFLGVIVDEKLKWDSHVRYISTKISRNIGVISKIRNSLNSSTKSLLYYSLVYPYMHYCSTVWGSANKTVINPLTILQKRIIRIIRGTNYRHHSNELFKDSKVLKLKDVIKLELLKFIHKLNFATNPLFPITRVGEVHTHNTRAQARNMLQPPRFQSSLSKNFVLYRGINEWNRVNDTLRSTLNPATFKIKLKKSIIESY